MPASFDKKGPIIGLIGSRIHSWLYPKALDVMRDMPSHICLSSSHWHVCSMVISNSSTIGSGSPNVAASTEPYNG